MNSHIVEIYFEKSSKKILPVEKKYHLCHAVAVDGNPKPKQMNIQDVQKLLLSERQDYGVYWIVNKLVQKNVPLNYGNDLDGYSFSAWLSNKERSFIISKLSRNWKREGNFHSFHILLPYAVLDANIRTGINNNICISVNVTPITNK